MVLVTAGANLDQQPLANAIKSAIQAQLPAGVNVYEKDEVPGAAHGRVPNGQIPPAFVSISLGRDPLGTKRASGEVTVPVHLLLTRCHGGNLVTVRELRRRVAAALEDQAYPLPSGDTIGPFVYRIGEPEEDDDLGWFVLDHWSFA